VQFYVSVFLKEMLNGYVKDFYNIFKWDIMQNEMLKNNIILIINKKTLIYWIAVFLWMLLIFNMSSQVAEQSDELSKGITKIIIEALKNVAPGGNFDTGTLNHLLRKNAHFFAYLFLGILVTSAIKRSSLKGPKVFIISLLICVLYAISDEVHQLFVPGRGPGVADVLIDSMGALVGVFVRKRIH
jgi:VanZ family protein